MPHILGSYPQKTRNDDANDVERDSLGIRFGSLERDCSPSNFNFTEFFLWLTILLVLIVVVSWFYDTLFPFTFFLVSFQVVTWQWFSIFSLPLCTYCLAIFYRSNLRMSIGYLQPLVKNSKETCPGQALFERHLPWGPAFCPCLRTVAQTAGL